ncbi:MAG: hypothetical protein CYG60_09340 [Actinobacteria bacterium]|jgi:hypothetical protein|nr:hypothetical protein [Actinomycetota bacterium]PLS86042.1 MAG: hypothetical protein CYG60_09340 [Actinomycetota bacterium]
MLTIKLTRAYEPEMMKRQPCGICGAEFQPEAVLAQLVGDHEHTPICEVCFHHLARRAEEEPIPAGWDEVYRRYVSAVNEYAEPLFPSVDAVIEAEERDPEGTNALIVKADLW